MNTPYKKYQALCAERGVNTRTVCNATGISENVISNWKKRDGHLTAENFLKLGEYFNVPIEYFLK